MSAPLLVLLGVSGSGKTSVGRILSRILDAPLVEADDLVEAALGDTVATLVVAGDPRLPDARREAARAALASDGAIATLGASQIEDPETAELVRAARSAGARVVELVAELAEVARREGLNAPRSVGLGAPRAMLALMIRALREEYADVADSSVETSGLEPQAIAEAIARECRMTGDSRTPDSEVDPWQRRMI